MTQEEKVLQGLRQLSKGPDHVFPAIVKDNHESDDYIDVQDLLGTSFLQVRKRAAIDGKKGIVITPVKESSVLVGRIGGSDQLYMAMCSEIYSVKVTLNDQTIILDKDGLSMDMGKEKFEFKNTQESLKKLIDDLNNAIMALTVTTGTGPSGTPINIASFQQIQQRIPNLFK